MAKTINAHPFILMVSATVAASCAFMLPVATHLNAVVFGSDYLRIPDMIKSLDMDESTFNYHSKPFCLLFTSLFMGF
tara:strand:+ start:1963 stop:2193 length:231 start_codon:yes stop_codon:yes gene_type:complete